MYNSYSKFDRELIIRVFFTLLLINVILLTADIAFAVTSTSDDVIGNTLCRLISNLSGNVARGIATIAIFAVGVGLFLGKLNWGIAAATAAGVGIIFSAGNLVSWLAGTTASTSCPA